MAFARKAKRILFFQNNSVTTLRLEIHFYRLFYTSKLGYCLYGPRQYGVCQPIWLSQ